MLSAAHKKLIRALHRKTERQKRRLFIIEGPTMIWEAMRSRHGLFLLAGTPEWNVPPILASRCLTVLDDDLRALSTMECPNQAIALVEMPDDLPAIPPSGLALCLDGVRDPGNMGTILRSAAWFGVERIVCSPDCVERFNPKVVQASMGAIFRVPVHVADLATYLGGLPDGTAVVGAVLDGENVYNVIPSEPAVLVLGNEAHGLSPAVRARIRQPVTIPRLGFGESLNVAMAATLLCGAWKMESLRGIPVQR